MTDAATVSAADRQLLAAQLSERLAGSKLIDSAGDNLELGEAFRVHVLRSIEIAGKSRVRRLRGRLPAAPYLHFQIRRGGNAILAAHAEQGVEGWHVGNLFGAALAPKLQDAVAWIDAHLLEDGEARLLLVPECSVVAFWIEQPRRDRIVLVSGADSGAEGRQAQTPHKFLSALFGDYAGSAPTRRRARDKRADAQRH